MNQDDGTGSCWSLRESTLRYKYRRRTKTVVPILEERYIRQDIGCGLQGCPHCPAPSPAGASLPPNPPVIIIPDGWVLYEYLDIWELPETTHWILTRSALHQFLLKAGLRQSSRLRAVYRDRRRAMHFMDDQHCAWTAHTSEPSPCAAAQFYAGHLDPPVPVIIVSDRLAGVSAPADLVHTFEHLHLASGAPPGTSAGSVSSSGTQPWSSHSSAAVSALASSNATLDGAAATPYIQFTPGKPQIMSAAEFFLWYFRDKPAVMDLVESVLDSKLRKAKAAAAAAGVASDAQVLDPLGTEAAGSSAQGVVPASASDWYNRPFLPQHALEEGLRTGSLLQGALVMSKRSADEGVVQIGGGGGGGSDMRLGQLMRISGRYALGRAMHGDKVAVRVLPATVVAAPAPAPLSASAASGAGTEAGAGGDGGGGDAGEVQLLDGEPEGQEEDVAALVAAGGVQGLPSAEVVGLLGHEGRSLVATLSAGDDQALRSREGGRSNMRESVLVVPYDRRYPLIRIRTRAANRLLGQRLVVQVDDWPHGSRYPDGHVLRTLGPVNDLKAEGQAVLELAGIKWQPFCDAALAELPSVPDGQPDAWRPAAEEVATRRDLTGPDYFVCSIDPVGCTDVDDALHVRFLADGQVEVGVHIADVSYFVRPHSMLDMEARDRCTSVYLVDRRLDMLPSLLSEQLCSLLGQRPRYAVSVIWTLREDQQQPGGQLKVVGTWFGRTIICSRHQLHYQQAQDILDGVPPAPGDALPAADIQVLSPALALLKRLTDQLHDARMADGALELESAELRFKTDAGDGSPTDVVSKAKIPMMSVIAEMMIWANSAVARRVCDAFPGAALLRCHPPPRQQALEQFREVLEADLAGEAAGRPAAALDMSDNKGFAQALDAACQRASRRDAAAVQLIKGLATRAMSEAKYFSTGDAPPGSPAAYHYGLALQYYTHFTSPIRRYADIVVHRQLLAALDVQQHSSAAATQQPSSAPLDAPRQPVVLSAAAVEAGGALSGGSGGQQGASRPSLMSHNELVAACVRMNDQHRAAKDAQQRCTELFLLLLLHKQPHVENALVVSIKEDGWLDLFIPSYQMKARTRLLDSRGVVRPPLTGDPEQDLPEDDAFATSARRHLALRCAPDLQHADVLDTRSGAILWTAEVWGRVWVSLSADSNSVHGPRLSVRAVSNEHPVVKSIAQQGSGRGKGAAPPPGFKPLQQAQPSSKLHPSSKVDISTVPVQPTETHVKLMEQVQEDEDLEQKGARHLTSHATLPAVEVACEPVASTMQARQVARKLAHYQAKLAAGSKETSKKSKWASKVAELEAALSAFQPLKCMEA